MLSDGYTGLSNIILRTERAQALMTVKATTTKNIGLMSKTTALNMHQTFWYILVISTRCYNIKLLITI